jgi:hypothetical protein
MTPLDRAACSNPIEPSVLMDYWLAALPSHEAAAVEEHLMTCDRCGDQLREAIALAEGLRTLARSGSLVVVVSHEFLQRARATGRRVRAYAASPGASVQCTVAADDDFLVADLAADLSGTARVDLSWCDAAGAERRRMTDIPVDAETAHVICQQSITFAKGAGNDTMIGRLLAVDENGDERLIGEYTFHHTRTIPGPPEWSS